MIKNIHHAPLFNIEKATEHYSKKDGVPVKYVFSSEFPGRSQYADIFFRETPHPEFGNCYFGLHQPLYDFSDPHCMDNDIYIFNADFVEDMQIAMVFNTEEKMWYYSSYRHDCVMFDHKMIDGGRDYIRGNGFETFLIHRGNFIRSWA